MMKTEQTCAKCGSEFRCGNLANDTMCWCMDLPSIPPEALSQFQGCLCPNCLKLIAQELKL
ncbi:MAG: hypothetical protein E6Q68_02930 [Polynucleobacter sp.]|nr:MAG: hypothetical protein E6Q68_02930 [Polynucleobacter sp.]